MPTVKVSDSLHSRLRELAKTKGTTIGGVIGQSLDVMEETEFWKALEATMGSNAPSSDADYFDGSLSDGLDPNETWEDILDLR